MIGKLNSKLSSIKDVFSTKNLPILLLLLIIPTFSALLRSGFFPMHDDMQAMRLLQMDKCVNDGQIPCRWVPDMGYGYGYPQFNFYPPMPYYVMEGFHLLGFGYLDSVKAGFVLSVLISALGMYLFAKSLWGEAGGFLSALLYAYIPYRAVNMYVRGAVGEVWALAFLPLILWSASEVLKGSKKSKLWLALSLAGLFTSHNITTLIFIPVIIAWVLFIIFTTSDSPTLLLKKKIKPLIVSGFWGFAISAFFLLPALVEQKFVHVETLLQGYFNYLAHFVSVGQLLFTSAWGYGGSELGPYDDVSFAVGFVQWFLPLLALLLLIILRKKKEARLASFFVILGWTALFMTHLKSGWIWDKVGLLSYLQFPWRFLSIAAFSFSVAAGAITLLFVKRKKLALYSLAGITILVILLYSSIFRPDRWIEITDSEKFSGELWQKQQTISIFDYLPIYAELPPAERASDEPQISEGDGKVISGRKGTNWQEWEVNVEGEGATIRLALFDFPGWKVWVDDKEMIINHDNELGLITFDVSSGKHLIKARLTDTPIRQAGNLLSLVGLFAIPLYLQKQKKK
jgi:hypothetical protein